MAIMPVTPAFAAPGTVLNVQITEVSARADNYDPLATPAQSTSWNLANGTVQITNNLATDLYDVTVLLNEGANTNTWVQSSDGTSIATTAFSMTNSGGVITVHIPDLPAHKYALLKYNVINPLMPVYLTTSYSQNKLPDTTNSKTTVTLTLAQTAGNTIPLTSISGYQVSVAAAPNQGWSLANGATTDNPPITTTSSSVTWNPTAMGSATFDAIISDPTKFASSTTLDKYPLATSTLTYQITSTTESAIGGVSVQGTPTGTTADISVGVTKQLFNTASDTYWQFTPNVGFNSAPTAPGISYTLSAVSLWITDGQVSNMPSNYQVSVSNGIPATLSTTGTTAWTGTPLKVHTGSGTNSTTDVYGFTNGVPVGFVKPTISIANAGNQIGIQYTNTGNTFTLQKYIWVFNNYWIEATKTISSLGNNNYQVTIKVQNLGSKPSPDVYVYDVVPTAFTGPSSIQFLDKGNNVISAWTTRFPNIDPTNRYTGKQAGVNIEGVNGAAYWWNVASLDAQNGAQDTMSITYQVSGGSGDYPLSQLYLVGLDPSLTSNLQSTPFLSNAVSLSSTNFEPIAALGALGLIVIGMFGTVRRRF